MHQDFGLFLRESEGRTFHTVTGLPFTYELRGQGLFISRVRDDGGCTFTYENLLNALGQMPVSSVAELKNVRGPSYCYAILKSYFENNA